MLRPHIHRPVAATAALIALLAAGCSSAGRSPGGAAARPPEKTNLTVAAVPTSDSAGLYIAAQRGYFAQQGLHVKIIPAISGATVIQRQLEGKLDVTAGNYVSYILQNALHHSDLRILAAGSVMGPNFQMIMVPPGSPITSATQLKGKTIAVNVTQNIGTVLVDSVLNSNAIMPANPKDVHYKAIKNGFPKMVQDLNKHKYAAAWMPEPFITEAEEQGARPVADADQGLTQNLPIEGYIVTHQWERKYPRTAAAFKRALLEGQRVADSNPPAVEKAIEKYTGIRESTADILASPTYPLHLDRVSIQRIANLMLQFGLIQHGYSTAGMIG